MMVKISITLGLIWVLVALQIQIWGQQDGPRTKLAAQAKEQQAVGTRIEQQRRHNAQLAREIETLQSDPNAIEARARRELGMIKADEKFIFVSDEPQQDD